MSSIFPWLMSLHILQERVFVVVCYWKERVTLYKVPSSYFILCWLSSLVLLHFLYFHIILVNIQILLLDYFISLIYLDYLVFLFSPLLFHRHTHSTHLFRYIESHHDSLKKVHSQQPRYLWAPFPSYTSCDMLQCLNLACNTTFSFCMHLSWFFNCVAHC